MTQKQLLDSLVDWISKHKNSRDLWSRNEIARKIRELIVYRGNWKNAPRGNPRRGYDKMMENKFKE